jgi:hypothetical protein
MRERERERERDVSNCEHLFVIMCVVGGLGEGSGQCSIAPLNNQLITRTKWKKFTTKDAVRSKWTHVFMKITLRTDMYAYTPKQHLPKDLLHRFEVL